MATKRKGPKAWTRLGVYVVTRHYGGPEEGGWWWNRYTLVTSFKLWRPIRPIRRQYAPGWPWGWELCTTERAENFRDLIEAQFNHLNDGDIGSVLGGEQISVIFETVRGEWETTEVPHYE